jgi:DivIVA domain-containing protein
MRKSKAAPDDASEWGSTAPGRITPLDVQQKEFHVTRVGAGYRMREVDEFLDQVTDALSALIAENERLKSAGTAGGGREAPPAAALHGADRDAVQAFLRREKGFLQDLGGLVQAHAEELRSMVRSVRRDAPSPVTAAEAVGEEPGPVTAAEAVGEEPGAVTAAEAGAIERAEEPAPATSDEDDGRAPETLAATPDEPIRLEEPEPARTRRSEEDKGDSLRELFWGEE